MLPIFFSTTTSAVIGTAAVVQFPQTVVAIGMETAGIGTAASSGTVLRTYGRINQTNGYGGTWVEVTTDAKGYSDGVYFTTLCQTLKLNLGESPFFGNYGIPAQQSVITQVFPDFYAAQTQTQFAGFFASLVINRIIGSNPPTYNVVALCHSGAILSTTVAT